MQTIQKRRSDHINIIKKRLRAQEITETEGYINAIIKWFVH